MNRLSTGKPMPIRLEYGIQHLPGFCRSYKCAFQSGHGGHVSALRQALCRVGYYAMDTLGIGPSTIQATINVRGEEKTVHLRGRNRQFNSLYFAKYAVAYEPEVALTLRDCYSPNMAFLDIGSNWGYFSLYIASQPDFQGMVHAFEPSPDSFRDLSHLVSDLGLSEWVACHPVALGAKAAKLSLSNPRHSGLAKLDEEGKGYPVSVCSLDSLNLTKIDLIKMDVEGFEYDVIRGGKATLRRCRPVIVLESDTKEANWHSTLSMLRNLSYDLFIPRVGLKNERNQVDLFDPYQLEEDRASDYENYYQPVTPDSRPGHGGYLNLAAIPRERSKTLPRVMSNAG